MPNRAALGALAALALLPASAPAATVSVTGDAGNRTITFTGAGRERNSVLVDMNSGYTAGAYQLEDQNNAVSPGPGCVQTPDLFGPDENSVRCAPDGVRRIVVRTGDGDDSVRFGTFFQGPAITDLIDGGAGDDTITAGNNGPSGVVGGPGNDSIDGTAGDDVLDGGPGNDSITGGPGQDRLTGGPGRDTLETFAHPGTNEPVSVTNYRPGERNFASGGAGDDILRGDNGPDTLNGDGGNDRIDGAGGADHLNGGGGNDILDEGDDPRHGARGYFPGGPAVADVVSGGSGNDTAQYCDRYWSSDRDRRAHPLTISLDRRANDGQRGERDNIGARGDVENLIGGSVTNDTLIGSNGANTILGDCQNVGSGYGNNRIFGRGGNDRLAGGDGNDLIDGGAGADIFVGNEGDDTIRARDGRRDRSINCDGAGFLSTRDRAIVDRSDPPARHCERT